MKWEQDTQIYVYDGVQNEIETEYAQVYNETQNEMETEC